MNITIIKGENLRSDETPRSNEIQGWDSLFVIKLGTNVPLPKELNDA